jgi:hypothetical protein
VGMDPVGGHELLPHQYLKVLTLLTGAPDGQLSAPGKCDRHRIDPGYRRVERVSARATRPLPRVSRHKIVDLAQNQRPEDRTQPFADVHGRGVKGQNAVLLVACDPRRYC